MNNKDTMVYKFYNEQNELLYIGIANNLNKRSTMHQLDKEWFNEIYYIHKSELLTRNKAHIYEIYYIAKLSPKYNKDFINGGDVDLELVELDFNIKINKYKNRKDIVHKLDKNILNEYLDSLINKKILSEEQKKLSDMVRNTSYRNTRSQGKMSIVVLNDVLTNELNLNYNIKRIRSSKRVNGKPKSITYWIIQKNN